MTSPIDALMLQAKAAADQARTDGGAPPAERERLERLERTGVARHLLPWIRRQCLLQRGEKNLELRARRR